MSCHQADPAVSSDHAGVYLDDCQIQPEVEAYAVDKVSSSLAVLCFPPCVVHTFTASFLPSQENAERLWSVSEELIQKALAQ